MESHDGGEDDDSHQQQQQLYVSLKLETTNKLNTELIPHVYGSLSLIGAWDSSKAVPMRGESASTWKLRFVLPHNQETLDLKFLLKKKYSDASGTVEEGSKRLLTAVSLQGDARPALFKLKDDEFLEYQVFIEVDRVSPFDLADSWRTYQDKLLPPSKIHRIPDVTIDLASGVVAENDTSDSLEFDLEHYVVPAPPNASNSCRVYAANMTESPRSLVGHGVSIKTDRSGTVSSCSKDSGFTYDQHPAKKEMKITIPELPKEHPGGRIAEAKSPETFLPSQKEDGKIRLSVDRGVGSPMHVNSSSSSTSTHDLRTIIATQNSIPAAAGAVAAAAVADQILGPKEDRHLAIVLVGLPARGKSFTAAKLTRYLRWLGHDTKHFNVGKYRRLKCGANQSADFFRADNAEGIEARNEVAALAMDDMLAWMEEGGQVGIFDATNSSRRRRSMLMKMAEGKCKIIFLETICNDERIIERNIRLKIQQSPDYAEEPDFEAGVRDFRNRLANYGKVYEPVEEGSYIKIIDMVSGNGGQIQVNNISGYLPGRIVFFLVNTHLTPRPILLTRHGKSMDNVRGRLGGDSVLSDVGQIYAKKLANFVATRLKSERAATIWTSTLQRTISTAGPLAGFPKIQWRALDEINAGICDEMTYEEIKEKMPEDYESRKKDKLRYRYPRGESYLDVIQRLEPVIIELERQRGPVVVISHQAVLRALYAYFADKPLNEIPHIEMPLHTVIEIQMGVAGVEEKRYKLMD